MASSFEEERRISENTQIYSDMFHTDFAFNANGDGVVVWYNQEYADSIFYDRIYLQRLHQDGSAVGSPILVSTDTDEEQNDPSVGIDDAGNIVVVWAITPDIYPLAVKARIYDSNGIAQGPEFQVHEDNDGNHYTPDLLVNPNGDFTVVWSSGMSDGFGDIYKRSFNADGSAIDATTRVNTTTSYSQTNPVISANSSGVIIIGWEAQGMAYGWDIAFRLYNSNGQILSPEILANSAYSFFSNQKNAAVAIDGFGNVTVAWDCFCDGNGMGIKARRFNTFGDPISNTFTVNTYSENNQNNPTIAMQEDGKSLITWTGEYTGKSGTSIIGQFFDNEGDFLGDELIISNAQTDSESFFSRTNPVAHVDEHKIYRVAWNASQSNGSTMGVFYNQAGMVNAGSDQVISYSNQQVSLVAENNSPHKVETWIWQQTSGISVDIFNQNQAQASFLTPQENGVMTFLVTATYSDGSQASDTVSIEVAADIPDVDAGEDFSLPEDYTAFLNGNATATGSGTIATILWEQISGPNVQMEYPDSLHPYFIAPSVTQDTTLVFQLNVSDTEGNQGFDQISITVENINQAPQVDAGSDYLSDENIVVNLYAIASDTENNIISYQWQQIHGPTVSISNANSLNASFVAPEVTSDTTLTFSFTATDSEGANDTDNVSVIVQQVNKIPQANAGTSQTSFDGEQVQLTGSGSDLDGTIVSYQWQQITGMPVNLINANSAIASFIAPEVSSSTKLPFRFTVTDNEGATAYTYTYVTIMNDEANQVPQVNAGQNQTVTGNIIVNLHASAKDDLGIQSVKWEQVTGPSVVINSPNSVNAHFVAPVVSSPTSIVLRLTVTDIMGLQSEDEITINVEATSMDYCRLSGNSTGYEWIKSVGFAGETNISDTNGGYGDFTGLLNIHVRQGQSYTIQLQPGFRSGLSYSENWYVWIDLNKDGQFDATSERVFTGSSRSTLSSNITIPSYSSLGSTRMRIAMKYGSSAPSTCGQYTYGEVEDYTINIGQ